MNDIGSSNSEVNKMGWKKVEKIKRKIRELEYYERYELMDWLNSWYAAVKEEQE